MAEPAGRHAGPREAGSPAAADGRDADLLAPLLPAGEPVEQLLRKAQFFVPGGTPSPDFREVHRKTPQGLSCQVGVIWAGWRCSGAGHADAAVRLGLSVGRL